MDDCLCVLCRHSLQEGQVCYVKENGLVTLRAVDAERHLRFFPSTDEYTVHATCRRRYISGRPDGGLSYKTWGYHKRNHDPAEVTLDKPAQKTRRSASFDVDTLCFICSKTICDSRKVQEKPYQNNNRECKALHP